MHEEFFIERQGRKFVLFAGLLDEAHGRGLTEIDTELLQIPDATNDETAIVKAIVKLERDGEFYTFSGIGDANPKNVSRNIAPHLIRMAETRAKARALRDAVNIGVTALEELGDAEESSAPAPSPTRSGPSRGAPSGQKASGERVAGGATKKAVNYVRGLAKELFGEEGEKVVEENIGHKLDDTTPGEASDLIKRLTAKKEEQG